MNEKLAILLMRHLTLLDSCELTSHQIFDAACRNDIDLVHFEMANRERVLKLIELFQSNVEENLDELPANTDLVTTNDLIKAWANDLNLWVNRIDFLDIKTAEILEGQKEEVTKEISSVFKSSENLKGYNLNNVIK